MKVLSVWLLVLLLCPVQLSSQDITVAVDVQYALFVKILAFDRNLPAKLHDKLVIGILHQPQVKASADAKDEFLSAFDHSTTKRILNVPVECVPVEAADAQGLSEEIQTLGINVLYITPMRLVDLRDILQVAQSERVLTLTGVPEYVAEGVAIGIGERGGRPLIIINLTEAKAQGADLSARLLKLARIIQ